MTRYYIVRISNQKKQIFLTHNITPIINIDLDWSSLLEKIQTNKFLKLFIFQNLRNMICPILETSMFVWLSFFSSLYIYYN